MKYLDPGKKLVLRRTTVLDFSYSSHTSAASTVTLQKTSHRSSVITLRVSNYPMGSMSQVIVLLYNPEWILIFHIAIYMRYHKLSQDIQPLNPSMSFNNPSVGYSYNIWRHFAKFISLIFAGTQCMSLDLRVMYIILLRLVTFLLTVS